MLPVLRITCQDPHDPHAHTDHGWDLEGDHCQRQQAPHCNPADLCQTGQKRCSKCGADCGHCSDGGKDHFRWTGAVVFHHCQGQRDGQRGFQDPRPHRALPAPQAHFEQLLSQIKLWVKKKGRNNLFLPLVLALPIFPVRLQTSIFGRSELNFRVRNGNGWTLALISTNLLSFEKESKQRKLHVFYFRRTVFLSLLPFSTAISLSNFQSFVKNNFLTHRLKGGHQITNQRSVYDLRAPIEAQQSGFNGKVKNCPPRLRSLTAWRGFVP